jgi:hypothetical protein
VYLKPSHRADFVLSWPFLASLSALFINDLILKPYFPGHVSGILSDFAGMIFFPLMIVAAAELIGCFLPGNRWATGRWFIAATAFVTLAFVVVKFTEIGEQVYWTLVFPVTFLAGPLGLGQVGVVSDPWDLLALTFTPIPIWIGCKFRPMKTASHI